MLSKIIRKYNIKSNDFLGYKIIKKSLDLRNKNDAKYVYSLAVSLADENKYYYKLQRYPNITIYDEVKYDTAVIETTQKDDTIIVVGSGPAGLFSAYELTRRGYKPIIIEQGSDAKTRLKEVNDFWDQMILNENSNVQFGEGGAGTFSDGKLNTRIKDPKGIARYILETLVKFGADESIVYDYEPHIGTDRLVKILENIRNYLCSKGCIYLFNTKVIDFDINNNKLIGINVKDILGNKKDIIKSAEIRFNEIENNTYYIETNKLILAIGHSARDTFMTLYNNNVKIIPKSFAVGIRIQHSQRMINDELLGDNDLPNANYKLTYKADNGRGVYTFCMCPGGYVVNASSSNNHLAINGMSYFERNSDNSNSAVIVTITPEDYKNYNVEGIPEELNGMIFQTVLENKAYRLCNGKIPVQLYKDFKNNNLSKEFGNIKPCIKGQYDFGLVNSILPEEITKLIIEGIENFDTKLKGFGNGDSIIAGVESRTSSPIRIIRDEDYNSNIKGIYPCGEGAGYAGGIISSAVDGVKVAEKIATSN